MPETAALPDGPDVAQRTPEADAATQVVLATFRANGLLIALGDLLTADEGLTSARWQVLGAIAHAERALTVPQIARRMGLTRQSVHVTVKRLLADHLVEYVPNRDHRRSQLVRLTDRGTDSFWAMDRRQASSMNRIADGLGLASLQTAAQVLEELSRRLEAECHLEEA